MTRITPRTLIQRLRPDHRRDYQGLPFIAATLDVFDHLLTDSGLGQSEDAKFERQGWNVHVQRVPTQKGTARDASYVTVSFIREIIARDRGGEYAWSTGFSYKAAGIEQDTRSGPRYADLTSFDLEAKGVMHFKGRRIDWENDPMNVELTTVVRRSVMDQEGDLLLPSSSYKRRYLARNIPKNHLIVGDQGGNGIGLDHERFTDLYELASTNSRSRADIGMFLSETFDAW